MVTHKHLVHARLTVTTGGTAYVISQSRVEKGKITRNENGFDTADFTVFDGAGTNKSIYYPDMIEAGSLIKCEMKKYSDTSWTTVFNGVIRFAHVILTDRHMLELKCDGAGYGFTETVVGEEYGTESQNLTLDKISEILTDGTHGIIPLWVNKILGNSGNDSGYSYTFANVEDIVGSMKYVYFPFKPCDKAIADLADLLQAIKGANAGCHWIVDVDNKFRLKTVGSDQSGWDDYYGGSITEATMVEGVDFLSFNLNTLSKEANYILYHGVFRKPADGDKWTENNSGLWSCGGGGSVSDEATIVKVGSYSLKFSPGSIFGDWIDYPAALNASWDISKAGGKFNIPSLAFYLYNTTGSSIALLLRSHVSGSSGNFILSSLLAPPAATWKDYNIPLGPYARSSVDGLYWLPQIIGGPPSWDDIDSICFWAYANTGALYVDGLNIVGHVLRGAKETGIGSSNKLKMKVVNDDVGKDDSLVASDDSGIMAQLAKAELYRSKTTPLVGELYLPCFCDMLPGQLVHIHAKKNKSGTFNIDMDMRIVKLEHNFSVAAFSTTASVTSDVKNSYPRIAWTNMNKVLASARPEFQDRQATSIKTRDVDITQTILEKTY
jgi:hypothetical protein